MVAEASKAVGIGCLGFRSLHVLLDQPKIHSVWDHRLFLEASIPETLWRVLWFLLRFRFRLWTEGGDG